MKNTERNGFGFLGFSFNSGLPWSKKLVEKYMGKWNWEHLSSNSGLPWSLEMIEKYREKWDWGRLCNNPAVFEKANKTKPQ